MLTPLHHAPLSNLPPRSSSDMLRHKAVCTLRQARRRMRRRREEEGALPLHSGRTRSVAPLRWPRRPPVALAPSADLGDHLAASPLSQRACRSRPPKAAGRAALLPMPNGQRSRAARRTCRRRLVRHRRLSLPPRPLQLPSLPQSKRRHHHHHRRCRRYGPLRTRTLRMGTICCRARSRLRRR